MDMGFGSQISPASIPVGSNLWMFAPASKTVDMIGTHNTVLAEGHRTLGRPQQRPTRPRKIRLVLLSSCLPTRSPKPPAKSLKGNGVVKMPCLQSSVQPYGSNLRKSMGAAPPTFKDYPNG